MKNIFKIEINQKRQLLLRQSGNQGVLTAETISQDGTVIKLHDICHLTQERARVLGEALIQFSLIPLESVSDNEDSGNYFDNFIDGRGF